MGSKTKFYVDIMAFNSEVTGSCTLCNVRFPDYHSVKFIVDCGMYQEKENEALNKKLEFKPEFIDFALVTHTHVDHIGRLPLLVKKGYRGPIYATAEAATLLMRPALADCQNVLKANSSIKGSSPLYGERDVEDTMSLVCGMPYFEEWYPHERIKVTFFQNAHVPGAALILVQAKCDGYDPINLLFTGDYNDKNTFFSARKLPEKVTKLPITIIEEATYGTTDSSEYEPIFEKRIAEVITQKNDILLLAYSFGRTQDILYRLKCMQQKGMLSTEVPIYLDGKLGMKYTKIYPMLNICDRMKDFLPDNLQFVSKSSRNDILNSSEKKIVITSSGTGSYGPAQCYLPSFLVNHNAYIAFTGYTPENTLGHKLKNISVGGTVKVGGLVVKRRAELEYFTEFSAHAKADVLLNLLREFSNLKFVLVNHGETEKKLAFADKVREEINPKMVGILDREYWFRVDQYGYVKSVPTKFM